MKVEFEVVHPDEGSSFRLLHQKVDAEYYTWQYHYHPEYEIVCVPYGRGTRHVGNHFCNYENGDLVLIGPNLPHSGFGLNANCLHEEVVVQIKQEVFTNSFLSLPEMIAINQLLEKAKCGMHFIGETKQKLTKKLLRLSKLSPFDRFIEVASILQIMASSTEYELLNPEIMLPAAMKKNNIRLQNIFTYVEQHYQEEIDIQKVASLAGLSVPSFCTYFKKIMKLTFTDFVNQYRIQRSCILLQQDKTISEACFDCGFNNVTYFNKVFKRFLNTTPSAFKKANGSTTPKN
ncbi:MAG TPA: AraC family transcriptional regulator [Chitinophagaceae bacterium]|jgi:AraC-like DNA-binding protein|nr:AraC family transcriptional regulator [Chitinophagaceae bacterium]